MSRTAGCSAGARWPSASTRPAASRWRSRTFCSATGPRWAERTTTLSGPSGDLVQARAIWVAITRADGHPCPLGPVFHRLYGPSAGGRQVSARLSHPGTAAGARRPALAAAGRRHRPGGPREQLDPLGCRRGRSRRDRRRARGRRTGIPPANPPRPAAPPGHQPRARSGRRLAAGRHSASSPRPASSSPSNPPPVPSRTAAVPASGNRPPSIPAVFAPEPPAAPPNPLPRDQWMLDDGVTSSTLGAPHTITDLGHDHVRSVPIPVTEIRDKCGRRPGGEVSLTKDRRADRLAARDTAYCHDLSGSGLAHGVVLTEETSC